MLKAKTQLSRGRLIRLYKELRAAAQAAQKRDAAATDRLVYDPGAKYSCPCSATPGTLLLKTGLCSGVDAGDSLSVLS